MLLARLLARWALVSQYFISSLIRCFIVPGIGHIIGTSVDLFLFSLETHHQDFKAKRIPKGGTSFQKIKPHLSCEIKDFVEIHIRKLRVKPRSRGSGCIYPHERCTGRSATPLGASPRLAVPFCLWLCLFLSIRTFVWMKVHRWGRSCCNPGSVLRLARARPRFASSRDKTASQHLESQIKEQIVMRSFSTGCLPKK